MSLCKTITRLLHEHTYQCCSAGGQTCICLRRCRPRSGDGVSGGGGDGVSPGWGRSPPPDDDRHGGTNYPGQEVVGQRPQPVQYVKPVKPELDGRVFAGERAASLPAVRRYGKRLETRPIFKRTVCHSHTRLGPRLSMTAVVPCSSANQRRCSEVSCDGYRVNLSNNPENFSGETLLQHFCKGAAILGWTQNALLGRRSCARLS
ncbi:hypothetical protein PAMP_020486 [Pampus punctatissimus]